MPKAVEYHLSDSVQDAVMSLFWEKGFAYTSIDDIVTITGLPRATLYKYFGGKEKLFVAMLKRYRERVAHILTLPLNNIQEGIFSLKAFFQQFSSMTKEPIGQNGCFLVATATDLPIKNNAATQITDSFIQDLRNKFYRLLVQAQTLKQIPETVSIESTATFLVGVLLGLMTLLRAQARKNFINDYINSILQYLDSLLNKEGK